MNAIKLFVCPERAAREAQARERLVEEEIPEQPDPREVAAWFDPRASAPFPQWVG